MRGMGFLCDHPHLFNILNCQGDTELQNRYCLAAAAAAKALVVGTHNLWKVNNTY